MSTLAILHCLLVNYSDQLQPSSQTRQSQAQEMMLSQDAVQLNIPCIKACISPDEQNKGDTDIGKGEENNQGGSSREQEALTAATAKLKTTYSAGARDTGIGQYY